MGGGGEFKRLVLLERRLLGRFNYVEIIFFEKKFLFSFAGDIFIIHRLHTQAILENHTSHVMIVVALQLLMQMVTVFFLRAHG